MKSQSSVRSTMASRQAALALSFISLASAAIGDTPKTLWVSASGSDRHPGTQAAPFATIQHAIDQAGPGTVINVGPGQFREKLIIRRSGDDGRPIILRGTKDAAGKLLTRIDGAAPVDPFAWQHAPEIADGVYKTSALVTEPQFVTVDGLSLPRLNRVAGASEEDGGRRFTALDVLKWPDGPVAEAPVPNTDVWATLGGAFTYLDGVTYIRLRNREDVRKRQIAVAPAGPVVLIDNASHIVLSSLEIGGGESGVVVQGKSAQHNRIEDCRLVNGRARIRLTRGAHHNTIARNYLSIGFLGRLPGAWWADPKAPPSEELNARRLLYRYFKTFASAATTSDDKSIVIDGGAADNTVESNHLEGGLIGIEVGETTNLAIKGNRIEHFSSVGMALRGGCNQVHVSGNAITDCNISIRLHEMNSPKGHALYIWDNRCRQPPGIGTHLYGHFFTATALPKAPSPALSSTSFIYHNTFVGGFRGIYIPKPTVENPAEFIVLNNVFSDQAIPVEAGTQNAPPLGWFSHNLVHLQGERRSAWMDASNIIRSTSIEVDAAFAVRDDSQANGIDLARPFQLDSKTFPPLPGLTPGYVTGEQPTPGVLRH